MTAVVIIIGLSLIIINSFAYKVKNIRQFIYNKYNHLIIFFLAIIISIFAVFNSDAAVGNKSIVYYKTLFLINQSRFEKAEKIILDCFKRTGVEDQQLLEILQRIYYFDGDHKKSIEIGKKILKTIPLNKHKTNNPFYIEIINSMALSAVELNENYSDYFAILKNYIKNTEDASSSVKETLGWLYINTNELKIGEDLIKKSVDESLDIQYLSPIGLSEIYYHLGVLATKKKDYENSIKYFEKSIKFGKENYFGLKSSDNIKQIAVIKNEMSKV